MKNYHFSCGNSTEGIVGLCAEIVAETREEAVQKLRAALEDTLGSSGVFPLCFEQSPIRYINVYVNPDYIGVCQIEEQEQQDSNH